MYETLVFLSVFSIYATAITVIIGFIAFLSILVLNFLKYMKYYYTIYKHPEIFGNPKDISWEVKKILIKEMANKTEYTLKKSNPIMKNENNLKIYSEENESA